jgi:chromosomal replication initiation ATPase DnaA
LEQLTRVVCEHFAVNVSILKENSRLRKYTKIRATNTWLACEFNICTLKSGSLYFNRDAAGLIRTIQKLLEDSSFRDDLYMLKKI